MAFPKTCERFDVALLCGAQVSVIQSVTCGSSTPILERGAHSWVQIRDRQAGHILERGLRRKGARAQFQKLSRFSGLISNPLNQRRRQPSSSFVIADHHKSLSVIISHHQSTSVILSHHHSPSVIISHRQSSSVIISHHQSSLVIISHHQSSFSHHQSSSVIISHHQSSSVIISHHQSSAASTSHHQSPSVTHPSCISHHHSSSVINHPSSVDPHSPCSASSCIQHLHDHHCVITHHVYVHVRYIAYTRYIYIYIYIWL